MSSNLQAGKGSQDATGSAQGLRARQAQGLGAQQGAPAQKPADTRTSAQGIPVLGKVLETSDPLLFITSCSPLNVSLEG